MTSEQLLKQEPNRVIVLATYNKLQDLSNNNNNTKFTGVCH